MWLCQQCDAVKLLALNVCVPVLQRQGQAVLSLLDPHQRSACQAAQSDDRSLKGSPRLPLGVGFIHRQSEQSSFHPET